MIARRVLVALAILAAASVVSFRSVYEPDLGWHLAHGRESAAGRIVRANVFSFTYPDYRQRYTSWLSELGAYEAFRIGGDAGIQTLQAATLAAALGLVYVACRIHAGLLPSLALLLIGFFVLEPRAMPRPHLVSFAGIAACSWLVHRTIALKSSRPLLWAAPMTAAWSNFHGEVVFGVAFIGLFAVTEWVRPSALTRHEAGKAVLITVACTAALLSNPYGWGLILYLYENAAVPGILAIAELQPPSALVYRAFFAYIAIAAIAFVSMPRRLTPFEVLTFVVFAALGLRFIRLTPLVFLATAPMVASRLAVWAARGLDPRAMITTALAASIVLSRVPLPVLVSGVRIGGLHPEAFYPSAAITFARTAGLEGPVFNSHNLGGWLAWTMYPEVRVFQDSRLQAYPPEHFRVILDASRSPSAWDSLTADVDWAVLSLARPNALSGVGRFPDAAWATVYADDAVEIVVRRSGRFAHLVSRAGD